MHMIVSSGFSVPDSTPHCMGPLDSLLQSMISISISCYRAPSDTISSGGVLERGLLTLKQNLPASPASARLQISCHNLLLGSPLAV